MLHVCVIEMVDIDWIGESLVGLLKVYYMKNHGLQKVTAKKLKYD